MRAMCTNLTVFALSLFLSVSLWGQERTLSGTVTDGSGQALIGANVSVKGGSTGTITDINGKYEIRVTDGVTVEFSYVGYSSKEVTISGQSTLDVVLRAGEQLDEVVVTALGISREEKKLGYTAERLDNESITAVNQPNVINAMQGQITGATISATGGGPGQAARIVLRGNTSFLGNNEPLFVIDGIPVDNQTLTVGGGSARNVSNRLADLNPDDIESMTILKSGAATALYGSRGANGVIVITTKSGQKGISKINFSTSYGVEEVNKFPETQKTYTQGFGGNYDPNSFWPSWGPTVDEARQIDPDHPAEIFNNFENAYQQGQIFNTNLNFSGGNDRATFYSSMGYQNHEGTIPFSDFERFSVLFKGNLKVTDWFNVGASVNYINSGGNRVHADRFNERLVYWAPQADVTDFRQENGTMNGYRFDGTVGNNPIYGTSTNKFIDDVNRYVSNLNFELKPFDWMTVRYKIGMDEYSDFRSAFAPGPQGIENEGVFESNGDGFVTETQIQNSNITSLLSVQMSRTYGDFGFDLTLGNDIFEANYERITTDGRDLDIYNLFNLGNAQNITTSQFMSQQRLIGAYGLFTMSYQDWLYVDLSARNDWSSTLAPENRSFFYPSASLSMVLSDLMDLPSSIDYLKFRTSYAGVASATVPYRTGGNEYSPAVNPVTNNGSDVNLWNRNDRRGDPNLLPEQTTTFDIGFDVNMFNNRLGAEVTYYNALSDNLIVQTPVDPATGFDSYFLNAGSMRNQGVELVLRGTPIATEDFSWDLRVNFTANRNRIESIRDGLDEILLGSFFGYAGSTATMRLREGQEYGNIFGTSWARYYANPEDAPTEFVDRNAPQLIGENGFPLRNTDPLVLGNSQPDWILGLNSSFSYKNWSLGLLFDVRQGVQKYNQMGNFFAAFGIAPYTLNRNETVIFDGFNESGEANTKEVWLGQGEGPDGENYGAGYYRNYYRGVTDNFVEDASWIRLRSLNLAYSLPKSWLGDKIGGITLAFIGNNLWLSTPYTGFDPEGIATGNSNADGFAGFNFPNTRSYTFRVNVNL